MDESHFVAACIVRADDITAVRTLAPSFLIGLRPAYRTPLPGERGVRV